MKKLAYILLVFSTVSCQYLGKSITDEIVARVHDDYLYQSDLEVVYPGNMSLEDSLNWVTTYINNWAREQLVLNKARLNLSDEQKEVELRVQRYKNSLLRYADEQKLVAQKLDSAVSREEILEYYEEHEQDFILKDHIIRATIIAADLQAPKIPEIRRAYRLRTEGDRYEIEEFCKQFGSTCQLNDSLWIEFKDLQRTVPIVSSNPERYLANLRYTELRDTSNVYFIHLHEYQLKGTIAPLSFVKEQVKDIVIHERKIELLKDLEESLYTEAQRKNYFETY